MFLPVGNLDDVKGLGAIPKGKYRATVTQRDEIKQGKGGPYIPWTFTVSDGECAGATLFYNTPTSPPTPGKRGDPRVFLKALLEATRVKWTPEGVDLDLVMQREMLVDVGTRYYCESHPKNNACGCETARLQNEVIALFPVTNEVPF